MKYQRSHQLGPKELVLNLLRASAPQSLTIALLIRSGEHFAFTSNQIRVTVNRLLTQKRILNDGRGDYRLADSQTPVWQFAQSWKQGERRTVEWDEASWLTVLLDKEDSRSSQSNSQQALWNLGFRRVSKSQLFVRPGNLARSFEELQIWLKALGLADSAVVWLSSDILGNLSKQWRDLWRGESWQEDHSNQSDRLEKSLALSQSKQLPQLAKESIELGAQSTELLIKDPLLPKSMDSADARRRHTELMLQYDNLGRELWQQMASREDSELGGSLG